MKCFKKTIATFLISAIALSLVGCNGKPSNENSVGSESTTNMITSESKESITESSMVETEETSFETTEETTATSESTSTSVVEETSSTAISTTSAPYKQPEGGLQIHKGIQLTC